MQIHNTMSRRRETFEPREPGRVGLYVCGITVYDHCHIGHARALVVYDILFRHLQASGFDVTYVRNITDVDDKIIDRAAREGVSADEISERFIASMHKDAEALGTIAPTHEPRAMDSIDAAIDLIKRLIDSGHAYAGDNGDVYYAVASFDGYGKLSGRKPAELRSGLRVAVDEHKRDPLDFVMWKAAKPDEPQWPSPWGPGRPGWHIECSAMSMSLLGETFDIHGGGLDLEFPHHENEIAQSEAATGKLFARYWMHNGLVRVDDEKMSKSLGNFTTIRDVLERYDAEQVRAFIVASHYRSPLNYSDSQLDATGTALRRLYNALRGQATDGTELDTEAVARFDAAMNDDLNTPEAMAVLHDLAGRLNVASRGGDADAGKLASTLRQLGARLGLLQRDPDGVLQGETSLPAERIDALIAERAAARVAKDFARSDEIRDELAAAGIALEDSGGKTTWRREG